jgi:uncharacterized protein (UPF0548 family)
VSKEKLADRQTDKSRHSPRNFDELLMMLTLQIGRPSDSKWQTFVAKQAGQQFSYAEVGATAGAMPDGYAIYRGREELGRGETCFRRAKAALDDWRQLRLGWLDVFPNGVPLKVGEVVAVGARIAGVWSLNACRIVYVVDEQEPVARYGFAYGTLPDHIAAGEGALRCRVESGRRQSVVRDCRVLAAAALVGADWLSSACVSPTLFPSRVASGDAAGDWLTRRGRESFSVSVQRLISLSPKKTPDPFAMHSDLSPTAVAGDNRHAGG